MEICWVPRVLSSNASQALTNIEGIIAKSQAAPETQGGDISTFPDAQFMEHLDLHLGQFGGKYIGKHSIHGAFGIIEL